MARKAFTAEGAAVVGPYSHAVRDGDLLFVSGRHRSPPDRCHR